MYYQPDDEPSRGRNRWVKVVAIVIVAAMVLSAAAAVVPMIAAVL